MIYVLNFDQIPEGQYYSDLTDDFFIENGESYSLERFLYMFNNEEVSAVTQVVREISEETLDEYYEMIKAFNYAISCDGRGILIPIDEWDIKFHPNQVAETVYSIATMYNLNKKFEEIYLNKLKENIDSKFF